MKLEAAKEMDKRCVYSWLNEVYRHPTVAFNIYSDEQQIEFAHDALVLLKEQEEEIENLKQTAQSMMEGICLLKEQEAKQVIRKQCKKEHDDGSIDYFAEWYCPHCNMLILRGFDNPSIKFCYKCGKPILWEGR